nr:MAG TPA: hypothetical protein [Caudoviricetes sp.]DAL47699.1 MAG TPA_asm: hypothetical protein [Caudoviricetes sp.]DAL55492.1 MAG TPA_asm: hypothetical protein [Caudoviricetes sp.]DAQ84046.1 MAG TPA: hypothetical protein [Caudoviricetes sp.]DAS07226.1 MAG TPA: hypothetical protein [Caudoviricetes sp.]
MCDYSTIRKCSNIKGCSVLTIRELFGKVRFCE